MDNIIVEWKLAGWAENVLVILLGIARAGLAAWLVLSAVKDVLDRVARVEELRMAKAEKAIEEWEKTFGDERARRIVAEQRAKQDRSMRQQLAKGEGYASTQDA